MFYGCAGLVSLNLLWLLTYKEVDSGADRGTGVWQVAATTARELMNRRLIAFILITSVFWAVLNQLWDMLPNFIVDWVDSASLARFLPAFMLSRDLSRGPQVAQEWVINFNPLLIIFCVAPLSWYVNKKMRRLTSMFLGFVTASLGVYVAGLSMSIYLVLAGIACFTVGEMLCSPKMSEYLGVIAPADKKALYMGYANIPLALGWGYGSYAGGQIYAAGRGEGRAGPAVPVRGAAGQGAAGAGPGLCVSHGQAGGEPGPGDQAPLGHLRPQPGLGALCPGGPRRGGGHADL